MLGLLVGTLAGPIAGMLMEPQNAQEMPAGTSIVPRTNGSTAFRTNRWILGRTVDGTDGRLDGTVPRRHARVRMEFHVRARR